MAGRRYQRITPLHHTAGEDVKFRHERLTSMAPAHKYVAPVAGAAQQNKRRRVPGPKTFPLHEACSLAQGAWRRRVLFHGTGR